MLSQIKKFLPGNRDSYQHALLADALQELCREVADNPLEELDEDVVNQIVDIINCQDLQRQQYATQDISRILTTGLKQDYPHKQLLTVKLIKRVLQECGVKLQGCEELILSEVAKMVAKPSKRGQTDARRRVNQESMALLRLFGSQGQQVLTVAAGLQPSQGQQQRQDGVQANQQHTPTMQHNQTQQLQQQQQDARLVQQPPTNVVEEVHVLIEKAKGHTKLLEESILEMTSNDDDGIGRSLYTSLVSKIQELKQEFPPLLTRLSTLQSHESETLMARTLEAIDQLDNVRTLYEQVDFDKRQTQERFTIRGNFDSSEERRQIEGAHEQANDLIDVSKDNKVQTSII